MPRRQLGAHANSRGVEIGLKPLQRLPHHLTHVAGTARGGTRRLGQLEQASHRRVDAVDLVLHARRQRRGGVVVGARAQGAGRDLDDAERVLHLVHDHRRQLAERRQPLSRGALGDERCVLQRQRKLLRDVAERAQHRIAVHAAPQRQHSDQPAARGQRRHQLRRKPLQRRAFDRGIVGKIADRLRHRPRRQRPLERPAQRQPGRHVVRNLALTADQLQPLGQADARVQKQATRVGHAPAQRQRRLRPGRPRPRRR